MGPSGEVAAGARVGVSASGSDSDQCTAANCPFGGSATNTVNVISWSGGGTFGYYDIYGQWTPSGDP